MLDAVVVGAGVSGLYQLHRLRELGMSVRVVEAGEDVGGTWYWNRYPGARFDSESYSYAYSFSPELLDEWEWTEHFAAQPETLRYLQHVADRLDLRRDITFGVRVVRASWDDDERVWTVELDDGTSLESRFLVLAIGILSAPHIPDIAGVEDFDGRWFHTTNWPDDEDALDGKRVAVIGTGATAVQLIPHVARRASHLTVFQRTPNWCTPLRNAPIESDEQRSIRERQAEIFERCRNTFGGFIHDADRRKALECTPEERTAFYEELYAQRGFHLWMANFRDVLVDPVANQTLTDFVADKIRSRVHDPAIAARLVPNDHGYGTRRVPLETSYYEVYNQPNVDLVDVRVSPIVRITPAGIATAERDYDFDVIVFATGFEAVTGAFDRIDITGVEGHSLRAAWADGPRTLLGLGVAGFPNMFIIVGPHNAAAFCNMPRCIEHNVDWVTDLVSRMRNAKQTRVVPSPEAQDAWTATTIDIAQRFLFSQVDSWFTGPSAEHGRVVLLYAGGFPEYQESCREVVDAGYRGFELS